MWPLREIRDKFGKYSAFWSVYHMHTCMYICACGDAQRYAYILYEILTQLIYQLSIANHARSSIAWAQLTLASSPDHEVALDALYDVFYGDGSSAEPELATRKKAERHRPWTPHNSFAYDNPEGTVLTTAAAFEAVARYPTLLRRA